jgi:exopolysaccharide biosynthesis polyprenyl glycosylphosphotransferase
MKRSEIAVSASLVPIDYIAVVLAGISAYFIRYWQPVQNIRPVVFDLQFDSYLNLLWLIALVWVVSFAISGLYSMRGTRRPIDEISKIVTGSLTAVAIMMFVFFFSRSLFDSRFIIIVGLLVSVVYIITIRGLIRAIQHYLYKYGLGVHRTVIIGDGRLSKEAAESFKENIKAGYRVVNQFSDFSQTTEQTLQKMVQTDQFDEILVVSPNLSPGELNSLNDFSYVNHITLKFVADIFDFPIANFEINTVSGLPIVEVKKTRLDGWGKVYKRLFDITFSIMIIAVLSPLMALTALLIKLGSAGGIFFSYQRIGQFGQSFKYFKFRSMVQDAHNQRFDKKFLKTQENLRAGSPMMKFKDDPRITRVGRFIRKFSIDELPELFNVFIGKMSLVGPRPHEVEEVQKYKNHHRKVLTIKPGMTGMAQVSGRSDLDFDDEIRLDTWYMENWSPKLDFMILLKTPWAVIRGRNTD